MRASELDRRNIVSVDVSLPFQHECVSGLAHQRLTRQGQHDVRPDSMLILHAARQVVETQGFDQEIDRVRRRMQRLEPCNRRECYT